MGTKLGKPPSNERELNELLQMLYVTAKDNYENDRQTNVTGLLEVIASEPNIVSAIHKIKGNKGSQTAGIDGKIIDDYLNQGYDEMIEETQKKLLHYEPSDVRRVWIPKPGKKEKRPLGIPTVSDRIIQECVRNVLEPIAEAQFFEHSYGFRPMRDAHMAITRISNLMFTSKVNWVVEGDIKGFFDTINHTVMIRSLWNIGIRDKRVLAIVRSMLKAGVMKECTVNEMGTPQGGIISPLLANIYLNRFDQFITSDFEHKKLRKPYSRRDGEISAMRNHSSLKTCYFVRYADDWVILTDNKADAEKLKYKAGRYLKDTLKLELSEEKTLVTNVRTAPVKFLGIEFRENIVNGKRQIDKTPNQERFTRKMDALKKEIFTLRNVSTLDRERLIQNINRVNSIIVGIINYYNICNRLSIVIRKYAWTLKYTGYKSLKRYGGKWVKACEVANLIGLHSGHSAHIPAIQYKEMWIGLTDLNFAKWSKGVVKNQAENPYTVEGRELYQKRMHKRSLKERVDEVNSNEHALYIRMRKSRLYTFEYFMNRPYVYNRDKGKCKICNGFVEPYEVQIHHINPELAQNELNKVKNLITVHEYCHDLIHSTAMPDNLSEKSIRKLIKYRKKIGQ